MDRYKEMTREEAYASFRVFEKEIEMKYRRGEITREKANKAIENSRKNYQGLNYNKTLDRLIMDKII